MFSHHVFDGPTGRSRRRGLVLSAGMPVILCAAGLANGAADPQITLSARHGTAADAATMPTTTLHARVVVTGLNAAHGIRQVGRFHAGGPFTSNPEFLLQTQRGRALDPERVLIAVGDNLGAALGNPAHAAGTVLSIDPRAARPDRPLVVPADLGRQRAQPGGAIQIYSAQTAAYMNRRHNASARSADFSAVAGPRYLSINNAFGRPWIANAPLALRGDGSESVVDPDGAPLANAPSDAAGGVFAGHIAERTSQPKAVRTGWFASLWNRQNSGQLTPGAIERGAFGTALLGASPDGSGFAVFAVVTGTGAIAQVHVQDGVDGLAPAGTIDVGPEDPGLIGVAFKWNPQRTLFIADARRDRIVALDLGDDGRQFTLQSTRNIASPWLHRPVDLAAAVPEIANPRFASHTTLAGDSDLIVVNRGDGSLLRLRQDGTVLARATVHLPDGLPIGADRLRSIAVSADAQRLWLVVNQPGSDAAVLVEVPNFDAAGEFQEPARTASAVTAATRDAGAKIFATTFTPASGLGPLFNAASCLACHPGGGASTNEAHFARRIARMDPLTGRVGPLSGGAGEFAPRLSTRAFGDTGAPSADLPRAANVVSLRMPLSLLATSRIDEIPDAVIEAGAVSKGDGIKGRVQYVTGANGTQHVGRYGWKADVGTLEEMVAEAFGNEMGITSALAPRPVAAPKDDGTMVRAAAAFLRSLAPPGGGPSVTAVAQGGR